MTVTLDLPEETIRRLRAEARRRGVTLDQLVAEIASELPGGRPTGNPLRHFLGSGDSGDPSWATRDLHALRNELAHRRSSESA